MILLVWAALLMASPGADCRMLVDSITGGARSRRIGDRSYPVPVRSTSLLLDEDMDSYRVDRLPFLSRRAFPTSQWAGEVPIPYAGASPVRTSMYSMCHTSFSLILELHCIAGVEDYGHMFFWLFEPAGGPSGTAPLVVWLNGGPGAVHRSRTSKPFSAFITLTLNRYRLLQSDGSIRRERPLPSPAGPVRGDQPVLLAQRGLCPLR